MNGGGGNGGGNGNTAITRQSLESQTPAAVANQLTNARVKFGSVTVSTGPEVTGVSSTFDGQHAVVNINRQSGNNLRLDTRNTVSSITTVSDDPNRRSNWRYVYVSTNNSATLASVVVDWANNDVSDYIAGGYWVNVDVNQGNWNWDIGAYIDGPEFNIKQPPTLPNSGTATYEGLAGGLFITSYGNDYAGIAQGSYQFGEAVGTATLNANFANSTISGCIGCQGVTQFITPLFYDASTGQTSILQTHSASTERINFGSTPINSAQGTFTGTNVTIQSTDPKIPTFTTRNGVWAGQFSNRNNQNSIPRFVAGGFGIEATSSGGSRVTVIGAFGADEKTN